MLTVSFITILIILIFNFLLTMFLYMLTKKSKVPEKKEEVIVYLYKSLLLRGLDSNYYNMLAIYSIFVIIIYSLWVNYFIYNLLLVVLVFVFTFVFWFSIFNLIIKSHLFLYFKTNRIFKSNTHFFPISELIIIIIGGYLINKITFSSDLYFLLSAGITPALYIVFNKTFFRNINIHSTKLLIKLSSKLKVSNNSEIKEITKKLYLDNSKDFQKLISLLEQDGLLEKYTLNDDAFNIIHLYLLELKRITITNKFNSTRQIMLINNYVSILCNKNNDNILCHNDLLKTYWQHRLFFYKTVEKSLFFNSIKFRIRDDIKENPSIIIRQQLFDKLFNYPNKVSEADFNTFFKLMYIFEKELLFNKS